MDCLQVGVGSIQSIPKALLINEGCLYKGVACRWGRLTPPLIMGQGPAIARGRIVGHSRRAEAQPPFQPFSRLNKEQGPNSGPLLGFEVAVRKDGQGTHYLGGGAYRAPWTPSAAA